MGRRAPGNPRAQNGRPHLPRRLRVRRARWPPRPRLRGAAAAATYPRVGQRWVRQQPGRPAPLEAQATCPGEPQPRGRRGEHREGGLGRTSDLQGRVQEAYAWRPAGTKQPDQHHAVDQASCKLLSTT